MSESLTAQLARRRFASYRLPVLECCGCRDPLGCSCHDDAEITDRYVDGYTAAARHLFAQGLAPAPNISAMRAMWRRSKSDRDLARRVSELWEVAAA